MKEKICGVYMIRSNIKPERIYVGSSCDIKERWDSHRLDLKNNKHHSRILQNHYNKYGEEDLVFSILLLCERNDLIPVGGIVLIEQMFIVLYKYKNTKKPFFNINPTAGSPMGFTPSNETRKKLSNSLKGRVFSEEHRRKIGDANRVRVISEETRNKMRKPKTDEHKRHLSESRPDISGKLNPMFGKHHSKESIEKMSNSRKKLYSDGYVNPMLGRHHTEETKLKISKTRKELFLKR